MGYGRSKNPSGLIEKFGGNLEKLEKRTVEGDDEDQDPITQERNGPLGGEGDDKIIVREGMDFLRGDEGSDELSERQEAFSV